MSEREKLKAGDVVRLHSSKPDRPRFAKGHGPSHTATFSLPIYDLRGNFVEWYTVEPDELAVVCNYSAWKSESEEFWGTMPYKGEDRVYLALKTGDGVWTYASYVERVEEDRDANGSE